MGVINYKVSRSSKLLPEPPAPTASADITAGGAAVFAAAAAVGAAASIFATISASGSGCGAAHSIDPAVGDYLFNTKASSHQWGYSMGLTLILLLILAL